MTEKNNTPVDQKTVEPGVVYVEVSETALPEMAYTIDYTGCYHTGFDIDRIEKIADEGSQGPTEVVYLYKGPAPAREQPCTLLESAEIIRQINEAEPVDEWLDRCQREANPAEIPGKLEIYDGKLTQVVDASRTGWWRYHEHYDRDGYCDNPGRGY